MVIRQNAYRLRGVVAAAVSAAVLVACAPAPQADNPMNKEVAKVFAEFNAPDKPGCVVGVAREGAVIHTASFGAADIAQKKALDAQSISNIASTSKQFTAFSILLLADRKQLALDEPITKYVPELAASATGVTIRQLIHHTGGLRDYMGLLLLRGRAMSGVTTQQETIEALGRQQAPNAPPGVEFEYSNTGYFLLGLIVERVSGQSLKVFSEENIFKPLQMTDTTIVDRYPAGIARLARGYSPTEKGFDVDESAWEQTGDGQIHTTVADLLRWSENFHTGAVGGKALMQQMLTTGALTSGEPLDYAAGIFITEHRGFPAIRHGGGWAGYRTELLRFPQQHLAVAVLCNRGDAQPGKYAQAVADVYLPANAVDTKTTQQVTKPSTENGKGSGAVANTIDVAQAPVGAYRNAKTGTYLEFTREGDKPSVQMMGRSMPLREISSRVYQVEGLGDAYVTFSGAEPVTMNMQANGTSQAYTFAPAWVAPKLELFAGNYASEEAAVAVALAVKDGVLTLLADSNTIALQPVTEGEFRSADGSTVFRFSSAASAPKEFLYFTYGLRGLRFERKP